MWFYGMALSCYHTKDLFIPLMVIMGLVSGLLPFKFKCKCIFDAALQLDSRPMVSSSCRHHACLAAAIRSWLQLNAPLLGVRFLHGIEVTVEGIIKQLLPGRILMPGNSSHGACRLLFFPRVLSRARPCTVLARPPCAALMLPGYAGGGISGESVSDMVWFTPLSLRGSRLLQ
jgi:hypothetical protein